MSEKPARTAEFQVHFIDQQADFDQIMARLEGVEWLGFDTEFVGEKTYIAVLSLIQIVAEQEIWLIDPLKVLDLTAFFRILEDEKTLKITHAGDNDYKLLNNLFGVMPRNMFDTQVTAGFVGHNYPAGFGKLVEKELHVQLSKSHTVTDWLVRPLPPKAIQYAVDDVRYLPALWQKLARKLDKKGRTDWAKQENAKWEAAAFYFVSPYKEAIAGEMIHNLNQAEKLFLMRLYQWRRESAEAKNVPKERILEGKYIGPIAKAIKYGREGFQQNRILHAGVWKNDLDKWLKLYGSPATEQEAEALDNLAKPLADDPDFEWTMELLYLFVRRRCLDHDLAPAMVLSRTDFNRLRGQRERFEKDFFDGWRQQVLGTELVEWLWRQQNIALESGDGGLRVSMP